MRRPAELPYRAELAEAVTRVGQQARVAGPARRDAADVGAAPKLAGGEPTHLLQRARPRRIEHDGIEPGKLVGLQRVAEQVAVQGLDRYLRTGRGGTAGKMGVARGLGGGHARGSGEREGESAEAGEQVGDTAAASEP